MELTSKVVDAANKAAKSNVVVNSFLGATFVALSIRSMNQQRDIEALDAQKDNLVKSNKAIKKTIWDWKQQLYADASVGNAVVPLAKLKAIYGEAPSLQSGGDGEKGDGRSPAMKILI